MIINICTQIKNRLYQFQETFYKNYQIINQYQNVIWTIVDINSTDGLNKFIESNMSSNIHYFEVIDKINYSIPIAKNFSYRLSSGDYLFNLDADNFLGSIIDKIIELNYIPIYCNKFGLGVYGRIGCDRNTIERVGGYDESFLPAAHHEQDLMSRCGLLNSVFTHVDFDEMPIQNNKEDTIKNISMDMKWSYMNRINTIKKQFNIDNNIVNPNKTYTQCKFIYNFNKTIQLSENFNVIFDN